MKCYAHNRVGEPAWEEYNSLLVSEQIEKRKEWANQFVVDLRAASPNCEIDAVIWLAGQIIIELPEEEIPTVAEKCQCEIRPYNPVKVSIG
jgi:hypothetical protein